MQNSPLLFTNIGLAVATIIEFSIAIFLLRKDFKFRANQLLATAYIFLGLTIFINMSYLVFNLPEGTVELLHRITNVTAILFGNFIFATSSYIRFGGAGFKKPSFVFITLISVLLIPGVLFYQGVTLFDYNGTLQTSWTLPFLLIASLPILLLGSSTVYYFMKLLKDVVSDPVVSKQVKMSIMAYGLITVSYFVSRVPFYLIHENPDIISTVQYISLIASIMVVFFSVIIAKIFLQRKPIKS